jgi:hypothetical protein
MLLNSQKESVLPRSESERLMAPDWLLSDQQALYVDGVGHIDQYGSYVDALWSKHVIYFVRDYLFTEIQTQLQRDTPPRELRPVIARLNALNSDILQWEQNGGSTRSHASDGVGRS